LWPILQHEICALASFWRGTGNLAREEIRVCYLWQPNNNGRHSAFAGDPGRLTLPVNWAQIGPDQ
jgi:hypothetical protein